jgi:splicing factor 3A subunit 1
VIDKTAQFVAKCGPEFESRVLREQNNTKFAFLLPQNPYRPYYEHKVKEFKTGVVEEKKPEVPQAIIDAKAKEEEKKKRKEQMKALTMGGEQKKAAKPPPPDQFIINHPYIAPMDMDIIKLTAQFVARNGQKFLIGLTQRESRNPQFDFLKPTHALFGYFTSLVDAYTKCLMPNKDEIDKLKKFVETPTLILDKALSRFNWDEQEEKAAKNKAEEEEQERDYMATIDWHEFICCETVEFTEEDENIQLAKPMDQITGAPAGAPVPLDQHTEGSISAQAAIQKPKGIEEESKPEPEVPVEEPAKAKEPEPTAEEPLAKEDEELPMEEEEPMIEEEPLAQEPEIPLPPMDPEMKIRKEYMRQKKTTIQRVTQRCPITGQLIPAEEMSNHLKILLLDPKWKQQKDQLVERARKESAFADDVEANLASFVAKRPDLFGSVDEQIREAAEAAAEGAARDAGADAGPAHTMVPPAAAIQQAQQKLGSSAALPPAPNKPGSSHPALPDGGAMSNALVPGHMMLGGVGGGAIMAGVNARLPGTRPVNPIDDSNQGPDEDEGMEPPAKRQRLTQLKIISEGDFAGKYPNPIQLQVNVSLGPEALNANVPGTLNLEIPVKTTVEEVKKTLIGRLQGLDLAVGKMRLRAISLGMVLKNGQSLAFYNVGPGSTLELSSKQRGGALKQGMV